MIGLNHIVHNPKSLMTRLLNIIALYERIKPRHMVRQCNRDTVAYKMALAARYLSQSLLVSEPMQMNAPKHKALKS